MQKYGIKWTLFSCMLIIMLSFPIAPKMGGVALYYFIMLFLVSSTAFALGRIYIPAEIKTVLPLLVGFSLLYIRGSGWNKLFQLIFLEIIPVIIIVNYATDLKRLERIIDLAIRVTTVVAFLGLFESITDINVMDVLFNTPFERVAANGYRFGFTRSHGFNSTSINHGVFLTIILNLVVYRMCNRKANINPLIISYIAISMNCLMTFSRTCVGVMLLSQLFWGLKLGIIKKKSFWPSFAIIVLALSVVLMIFGFSLSSIIIMVFSMFYVMLNPEKGDYSMGGGGARSSLYGWVWNAMGKEKLLGRGYKAEFAYQTSQWFTKTSIEVNYLAVLFRNGIVGLGLTLIFIISVIVYAFKRRNSMISINDEKISLNYVALVSLLSYFIMMFGVGQSEDYRALILTIGIMIAYNHIISKWLGK